MPAYLVVQVKEKLFFVTSIVPGPAAAAVLCRFLIAEDVEARGWREGTGDRPNATVDGCSPVQQRRSVG